MVKLLAPLFALMLALIWLPNNSQAQCGWATETGSVKALAVLPSGTVISAGGSSVTAHDATGKRLWTRAFAAEAVVPDALGNLYLTGSLYSPTAFGADTLRPTGLSDIVLYSLDSNGNLRWAQAFGGLDTASGTSEAGKGIVYVAASNTVYITGWFADTLRLPHDTLTSRGLTDIFVFEVDTNGQVLRVLQAGGAGADRANALAYARGRLLLTGQFTNTAYFGGDTLKAYGSAQFSGTFHDIFVSSVDTSFQSSWTRQSGSSQAAICAGDEGFAIVGDAATGDVYATGYFTPTGRFGPLLILGQGATACSPKIFVASYDSAGQFRWAREAGSGQVNVLSAGYGITLNDTLLAVTGRFARVSAFGAGDTLRAVNNGNDMFLATYNTSGSLHSLRSFGGNRLDQGAAIAAQNAGSGSIWYIGGIFNDTLIADGLRLVARQMFNDGFVMRLPHGGSLFRMPTELPDSLVIACGDTARLSGLPILDSLHYAWSPAIAVADSTDPNTTILARSETLLTLTVSYGGCSVSKTVPYRIQAADYALTADFQPDSVRFVPADVQFTTAAASDTNLIIKWLFGDGDSSIVGNPTHTYSDTGTFPIRLIATHKVTGCADTLLLPKTVRVVNQPVTAIQPANALAGVVLWPNPVSGGKLNILLPDESSYNLSLYNPQGQLVKQFEALAGPHLALSLHDLPAGLYLVAIAGNGQRLTQRILLLNQ